MKLFTHYFLLLYTSFSLHCNYLAEKSHFYSFFNLFSVLAIALPIALALLILTMFCLLCGCRKLRQRKAQKPKQNVFKGMAPPMAGTLDRKAMIMDSSSESSGEHRPPAHAYDGFSVSTVKKNIET